jgi:hypothetical protein
LRTALGELVEVILKRLSSSRSPFAAVEHQNDRTVAQERGQAGLLTALLAFRAREVRRASAAKYLGEARAGLNYLRVSGRGCDETHPWEGSGLLSVRVSPDVVWPIQPWTIVNVAERGLEVGPVPARAVIVAR